MLKQLYIKNFTLIDTLDIHFRNGFSVITGETGAGKSIILGAINLLLGQRADSKAIKSGCGRCIIEAHFDLRKYDMAHLFEENDIDYDDEDCIIRRELTSSGKSRAFINDTPVPLTVMRILGQQLVDIHSQHQNLLLREDDFQLNVVDIIAQNNAQKDEYRRCFGAYKKAREAAEQLRENIRKSRENEDFLRFQYKELEEAKLEKGQQERLEKESETLCHIEEIKSALVSTDNMLSGNDDNGIAERLKEANRLIEGIRDVYPEVSDIADRLESCYIEIKDISKEIGSDAESLEFDPQRLNIINTQLDRIYSLQHKHNVDSIEKLIEIRDSIKEQLGLIENCDTELKQLEDEEALLLKECGKHADALTATRHEAAKTIEKEMLTRLQSLGMPNVRFTVCFQKLSLSHNGQDRTAFMFSANTNTPMMPVAQVASGGEVARVMLSLKAMISGAVKLPTIIFDEIDTGVSGKIAEKMALIMQDMGLHERQVISITHLPQIAARGATHYKVYKEETPQGTTSRMQMLTDNERITEIAQMLSGSDITEAAISNAKELLRL